MVNNKKMIIIKPLKKFKLVEGDVLHSLTDTEKNLMASMI